LILPPALFSANPWEAVGPSRGDVREIVIDPVSPSTVYAAFSGLGVYGTRDGTSWQFVSARLSAASITNVTSLGVSLTSELFVGATEGLFRSPDGGVSWFGTGFAQEKILAIAVDRAQPETIYASSEHGFFGSADSGATWTATHGGGASELAVVRNLPGTVYATYWPSVCLLVCGHGYVSKTSDGGRTWTFIEGLADVRTLLLDPTNPAIVYAGPREGGGVFKSIDGGLHWTATGADSLPFAVSALAMDSNAVLYAGTTEGGVFESFDGGQRWIGFSDGLTDLRIRTLVVADSPRGPTLYAGTQGNGIFRLAGLIAVSRPGNPSRVVQPRR
jgi:photosystem II stability/assembly factor-like uncharacterized protein